jgi:hypothetical protein
MPVLAVCVIFSGVINLQSGLIYVKQTGQPVWSSNQVQHGRSFRGTAMKEIT